MNTDSIFKELEAEKAFLRKMVTLITRHYRRNPRFKDCSDDYCILQLKFDVEYWNKHKALWAGDARDHNDSAT